MNFLTFSHFLTLLLVALFIVAVQFKLARHHSYHGSDPALEITATVLCNVFVTLQVKTGENLSLGIRFKFSHCTALLSISTDISISSHFSFSFLVLLIISTREKEVKGKENGLESSFHINLAQWIGLGNSKGVGN